MLHNLLILILTFLKKYEYRVESQQTEYSNPHAHTCRTLMMKKLLDKGASTNSVKPESFGCTINSTIGSCTCFYTCSIFRIAVLVNR